MTMVSFYSVLQYVPDPLADERVNVGVIAFDANTFQCQLLDDWRRVHSFGARSVTELRGAVRELEGELEQQAQESPGETKSRIDELARTWRHSIQMTVSRASTMAVSDLMVEMTGIMLKQSPIQRRPRTKTAILAQARVSLERVLEDRRDLVRGRAPVPGRYINHEVDLAVVNGKVLLAAQAISFARAPSSTLEKDVSATAWVIEDVRQAEGAPQLAVIVGAPDDRKRGDFVTATKLFADMDAQVVPTEGVDSWAQELAPRLLRAAGSPPRAGAGRRPARPRG
jgi:hypothetical protein